MVEKGEKRLVYGAKDESGVGATKSERVAQHSAHGGVDGLSHEIEVCGCFIGIFQIKIGRHEAILHHQDGIDHFASACHPTFVSGHAFGAADVGTILSAKIGVREQGLRSGHLVVWRWREH